MSMLMEASVSQQVGNSTRVSNALQEMIDELPTLLLFAVLSLACVKATNCCVLSLSSSSIQIETALCGSSLVCGHISWD
jgi:hypothetical protein